MDTKGCALSLAHLPDVLRSDAAAGARHHPHPPRRRLRFRILALLRICCVEYVFRAIAHGHAAARASCASQCLTEEASAQDCSQQDVMLQRRTDTDLGRGTAAKITHCLRAGVVDLERCPDASTHMLHMLLSCGASWQLC